MLKFGVLKMELLKLGKTDLQKQSSSLVLEIKFELKWFYSSLFHIFEKNNHHEKLNFHF